MIGFGIGRGRRWRQVDFGNASNITADPNGLSFNWNPRNQISATSGGVAATFSYDGMGRREISNATPPGAIQDFEYDGSSMIGWNTLGSSPLYNFLTIPGGAALAGSFTSGGTTTTWVPLIDASGSTLGLVNAASPQSGMVTTYTYDPSGTPTANGTANEWPFQYQGMEKEFTDPGPYYYSGSGQFYSPQFVRSLSEAGQTGSGGAGGPPPTQVAYGPGSEGNGSFGHWYVNNVLDPSSTGNQLGNLPDIAFGFSSETTGYVIPLGAIAQDIEEWVSFFEWLLGGSGAPPTPRQLLHGRHPLYSDILGIHPSQLPSEESDGNGATLLLAQASVSGTGSDDPLLKDSTPKEEKERIARNLRAQRDKLPVNSKQRKKIEKRLKEYGKRPSGKAHGADIKNKFIVVPWIPEAPLAEGAADAGLEVGGADVALDILLGALAF